MYFFVATIQDIYWRIKNILAEGTSFFEGECVMRKRALKIISGIVILLVVGLSVPLLLHNYQTKSPASSLMHNTAWKPMGPSSLQFGVPVSGRILSVAQSGGNLYVGSADGGLWASRNAGASWRPLSDHEPSLAIASIAIDPKSPSVMYLGTGEPHSFLGSFWYPNSFYGCGILKSTDGGAHWTVEGQAVFKNHSIKSIIINPNQTSTLLAAAGSNIYESNDSGCTWAPVYIGDSYHRVMQIVQNPSDPMQVYAGVEGTGLLVSKNGGQSWATVQSVPKPSGISGISIAIGPKNGNPIYCLVSNYKTVADSGLYESKDSGKTWTKLTTLAHVVTDAETSVTSHIEVAVEPTNPNHLFAGGYFIEESQDGGHSWTPVNPIHMDDHTIIFAPDGTAFFGTDGGIWSDKGEP